MLYIDAIHRGVSNSQAYNYQISQMLNIETIKQTHEYPPGV